MTEEEIKAIQEENEKLKTEVQSKSQKEKEIQEKLDALQKAKEELETKVKAGQTPPPNEPPKNNNLNIELEELKQRVAKLDEAKRLSQIKERETKIMNQFSLSQADYKKLVNKIKEDGRENILESDLNVISPFIKERYFNKSSSAYVDIQGVNSSPKDVDFDNEKYNEMYNAYASMTSKNGNKPIDKKQFIENCKKTK